MGEKKVCECENCNKIMKATIEEERIQKMVAGLVNAGPNYTDKQGRILMDGDMLYFAKEDRLCYYFVCGSPNCGWSSSVSIPDCYEGEYHKDDYLKNVGRDRVLKDYQYVENMVEAEELSELGRKTCQG